MIIPKNLILIWTGTNAAIPTGFSRVTALDVTFPKGADSIGAQNATGGSDTHSHTSPTHNHQMAAHTHTYDLDYTGVNTDDASSNPGDIINGANHNHTGQTTTAGSEGTVYCSSDSLTYKSGDSKPPYKSVIFIKATTAVRTPTDAIALFASATLPSGWNFCDGTNLTTDLRNSYLRGAATNADAGGSGGAYTHSHDISHSHTSGASHTHTGGANHGSSGGTDNSNGGSTDISAGHGHSVTLNAATALIAANTDVVSLSETVEPAYKKLMAIQKDSSTDVEPIGLIGMWVDSEDLIPAGWAVCDGTNGTPNMLGYHLKISNDKTIYNAVSNPTGEVLSTGGSNTHTHAATSHSHASGGSHTHSGSSDSHNHDRSIDGVGGNGTSRNIGSHNLINCSAVSPTFAATNTTADSANNEPAYLKVLFVQFQRLYGGVSITEG